MELKTESKKIILVMTTRKLVKIVDILKGKNFETLYFKAMNEKSLEALAKIIFVFAEDAENGAKSFENSGEVFEFIDDYKKETKKSYDDIFKEIAEAINDEGFFNSKMTAEELKEKMKNPLIGMDMGQIVKNSAEKAVEKVAEREVMKQA